VDFRELIAGLPVKAQSADMEVGIRGIAYDSRQVQPGFLFVAIRGLVTDGHRFVNEAVSRGAAGLLLERGLAVPEGVAWAVVPDTRQALALVASRFYGEPARALSLIGVTGTNGKTTTTHLIAALMRVRHAKVGLVGTIHNAIGDEILPVHHTTPESLELQALLRRMADAGVREVVMEVSSHGLRLHRVAGLRFDVAVFTNLTQDHLDFHADMEDYFASKAMLFDGLDKDALAVVNGDDPYGRRLRPRTGARLITYGVREAADVRAVDISIGSAGVRFTVESGWGRFPLFLPLTGLFNVYNALAAVCVGFGKGLAPEVMADVLARVPGVPGRFERIDRGQDYTVIVDYAHTPDGLENVLRAAREVARGRVISVFGCGGDRDRKKRPLMGAVSAAGADYTVLTSDNPRSEEPLRIIADIEQGYRGIRPDGYVVVPDRREAIRHACAAARPGDIVVIAGKGHEHYQIIGNQRLEFDDRREAALVLDRMHSRSIDESANPRED